MLALLADVVTHQVIGLYDTLGLRYAKQLNAPGSAQVNFALDKTWPFDLADGFGVAKTLVYIVDPDTALVDWWGLVWQTHVDLPKRTAQLKCAGIGSVFARRTLRADLSWTNVDQSTIVAAVLANAQSGVRRDLHVTAAMPLTGHTRTLALPGKDRRRISDVIDNLSAMVDGFDYRYNAYWDGGGTPPLHEFSMLYPAPRVSPVVTLVCAGNVSLDSWDVDGTAVMTDIDSVGDAVIVTVYSDNSPDYPDLDGSVTHSEITDQDQLSSWGLRAIAATQRPHGEAGVSLVVGADERPPCQPGDTVRLIESDVIGVDDQFVVTDQTTTIAGAGRKVEYSLVNPATLWRTSTEFGR